MPRLGVGELLIVLAVILLVFGARRLPALGEAVGKAIRNVKRGVASDDNIDVTPKTKRVPKRSSARTLDDEVSDAEIKS